MKEGVYTSEEEDKPGTWWVCVGAGGHWAGQVSVVLLPSKNKTEQENIKYVSLKVAVGFFRVLWMNAAFKEVSKPLKYVEPLIVPPEPLEC